jgi:ABC-2 type transport system permease protein
MRTMLLLLQKEFLQIFRNKALIGSMLIAPIIQLIVLPLAANYEVKNINLVVVDHDRSDYSRRLVGKVLSSGYFRLIAEEPNYETGFADIEHDRADLVLEVPPGFERGLTRDDEQTLLVAVNAINGMKAGIGSGYLASIIGDFNREIRLEWIQPPRVPPLPVIEIVPSNWYNPLMIYSRFFVPGILVMLVTGGSVFLTTMNIVREKEIGTMEQINVTPIRKSHFVLGKLLPFWIIEMAIFTLGMVLGWGLYGIVPVGNLLLLYGFLAIYMVATLGIGLLISTYSETQQQAMMIGFFFMMIFNLMSGLYTPIDSMPGWAKVITQLNPVTYFIEVMRMVVLKGSGFWDIRRDIVAISAIAIVVNAWAIASYKKTS